MFSKEALYWNWVVYLSDYILEHMDRQMITGAVFVELKKAFDFVDPENVSFLS